MKAAKPKPKPKRITTSCDGDCPITSLIQQGFLRELRMRTPSVSRDELARLAGIKLPRLSEIENRRGKRPTHLEGARIARALFDGVCRRCGCTDEWGCDVGCSWANAEHTLCSECVGWEEASR